MESAQRESVACHVVITVKHNLIECADLLEIRKKYFKGRSLYSLFQNVIPEIMFDFLREIDGFLCEIFFTESLLSQTKQKERERETVCGLMT